MTDKNEAPSKVFKDIPEIVVKSAAFICGFLAFILIAISLLFSIPASYMMDFFEAHWKKLLPKSEGGEM